MNKKFLIPIVSAVVIVIGASTLLLKDNSTPANSTTIQTVLDSHKAKKCYIEDGNFFVNDGQKLYKISTDAIDIKSAGSKCEIITTAPIPLDFLALLLTIFMLSFLFFRYTRNTIQAKAEALNPSKSSEAILPISSDCTFDDIAGVEEAKEELFELVDYLKNPAKYAKIGIRMPRGVLLVGPPGVGKTLLAKALANSAGVPFYYKSAATFVEMYVGVGAKRVSDLFAAANKNSPAIIFIDEIDAIGRKRSGDRNEEREATLNQLLTEMDGFASTTGVLAIAATNKPDVLDEALLRANRFDRKVFVDLPDLSGRVDLFKLYLKGKPQNIDIEDLARSSVGFSGAMISSYVNEAALNAYRHNRKEITNDDFRAVAGKVIDGKKRALALDQNQRELLATGQAAKLLLSLELGIQVEHISLNECRIVAKNEEFMSETEFMNLISFYISSSAVVNSFHGDKYAIFWQDEKKAYHQIELAKTKYMLFETMSIEEVLYEAKTKAIQIVSAKPKEFRLFTEKMLNEQKI